MSLISYSELQLQADEVGYRYVKLVYKYKMYASFQDYANFNVFNTIGQLGWYEDSIMFVLKNGAELKRKFELDEFIDFANRFRIISIKVKLKTFAEYKKYKIRNVKPKKKQDEIH